VEKEGEIGPTNLFERVLMMMMMIGNDESEVAFGHSLFSLLVGTLQQRWCCSKGFVIIQRFRFC